MTVVSRVTAEDRSRGKERDGRWVRGEGRGERRERQRHSRCHSSQLTAAHSHRLTVADCRRVDSFTPHPHRTHTTPTPHPHHTQAETAVLASPRSKRKAFPLSWRLCSCSAPQPHHLMACHGHTLCLTAPELRAAVATADCSLPLLSLDALHVLMWSSAALAGDVCAAVAGVHQRRRWRGFPVAAQEEEAGGGGERRTARRRSGVCLCPSSSSFSCSSSSSSCVVPA